MGSGSIICHVWVSFDLLIYILIVILYYDAFAWLRIFDWMSSIVNFTLLGSWYFHIPINILECYCRAQLSYLEIAHPFEFSS